MLRCAITYNGMCGVPSVLRHLLKGSDTVGTQDGGSYCLAVTVAVHAARVHRSDHRRHTLLTPHPPCLVLDIPFLLQLVVAPTSNFFYCSLNHAHTLSHAFVTNSSRHAFVCLVTDMLQHSRT